MAISEATITVLDGGLGVAQATGDQVQVKIGIATAGSLNAPAVFSNPKSVADAFGSGAMVAAAQAALAIPGSGPVMCVAATPSGPGSIMSSAPGDSNTGTGTYTFTGTPNDAYSLVAQVTAQGANKAANTGAFVLSLDGGKSYSSPIAIPSSGSYAIPGTSAFLTFADGSSGISYQPGDTVSAMTAGPTFSNAAMVAALDAAVAFGTDFALVHVVGQASSAANCAAQAGALDAAISGYAARFRYFRGIVECPQDTDANLITAFASFASAQGQVGVAAGFVDLVDLQGRISKRHAAWPITARAGSVGPSEDLGRVKSGPLRNVLKLYRDEENTQGLDAVRFMTLRSIIGKQGYFVTSPNMMAPGGSDFSLLQRGRVMDIAAKTVRASSVELLRDELEVDATTGLILEGAALAIEREFTRALEDSLLETKDAVAVRVSVDRSTNLLSNPIFRVSYGVVPKGYALEIVNTLAFLNPALAAV